MSEEAKIMNIQLTEDQIVMVLDCIENRIDDLNTCAMYGDGVEIQGEIQILESLSETVAKPLESAPFYGRGSRV